MGSAAQEDHHHQRATLIASMDLEYESNDRSANNGRLKQTEIRNAKAEDTQMPETNRYVRDTPLIGESQSIKYTYGESSRGDFIAAADKGGLSAILFGSSKADLLNDLHKTFPACGCVQACPTYSGFLINAVTRLVECFSTFPAGPTSIGDTDLGQRFAALRSRAEGIIT